nr:DNA primase small subunit PriS [Candidatus Njordarchaeota archaeon]
MDTETQLYLTSRFREYYEKSGSLMVVPPKDLPEREFAFTYFDREGMFRHIGFPRSEELLSHLRVNAPSHAYLSAAHYVDPDAGTMGQKGWKGTDLIFDIDADHLDVPCKEEHDRWVCRKCGETSKGKRPEQCPSCQSTTIEEEAWLCEQCIAQAKSETFKLIDILSGDFGFSRSDIDVIYTGHRGYHVKVDLPSIHPLTPSERREIVDYITGRGILLQAHGLIEQGSGRRRTIAGPGRESVGWGLRIYRSIVKMFGNGEAPLEAIANKNKVLEGMAGGRWDATKGIALKTWERLVTKAMERYGIAHIDEPVTTDIHRLIRLEGSLHGKTGFAVTKVRELESFDPFKDAVVLKSDQEINVYIERSNAFRVGENSYGPYEKVKLKLPLAAAIFFMCKGVAKVIRET